MRDQAINMSTSTQEPVPKNEIKEEVVIPAAESEATLATLAMPLGESVLKLQGDNLALLYGVMQRNRAVTRQSDFFRVQFRGIVRNNGHVWTTFADDDEDARFHSVRNCAWVRVDHPSRSVTFGPKSGINVGEAMRGPGLAEFLFSAVVSWAKNTYPEYSASPGTLLLSARLSDDEKLRKQAFYAKQGFEFEWSGEGLRTGTYQKDQVSRLIGVCDSTFIAEFSGETMLQTLIRQDEEHQALQKRLAKSEALNNAVHQALDKERHTSQALIVALVLTLLMVLWSLL